MIGAARSGALEFFTDRERESERKIDRAEPIPSLDSDRRREQSVNFASIVKAPLSLDNYYQAIKRVSSSDTDPITIHRENSLQRRLNSYRS